jgi:hypothetical protein
VVNSVLNNYIKLRVGLKNDIYGVKFALVLETKLTKGRFFLKNWKKN